MMSGSCVTVGWTTWETQKERGKYLITQRLLKKNIYIRKHLFSLVLQRQSTKRYKLLPRTSEAWLVNRSQYQDKHIISTNSKVGSVPTKIIRNSNNKLTGVVITVGLSTYVPIQHSHAPVTTWDFFFLQVMNTKFPFVKEGLQHFWPKQNLSLILSLELYNFTPLL